MKAQDPLHVRQLWNTSSAPADPWVSLRCALGTFTPLLVLVGLDRLDLAVFVVFAAFTNVYGRVPGHVDRLITQLKGGGSLWLLMIFAWLASRYLIDYDSALGPWTLVALTALVSAVMAAWAGWLRIRPAGSLFHIFCFAAIASYPVSAPLGDGMFAGAATLGLALVLGQLGRLWPRFRTPWVVSAPVPLDRDERRGVAILAGMHAVAVLAAGASSILIAPHIGAEHLYWALLAAVVPLVGHNTRHGIARGLHRVLGTGVGLGVLALLMVLSPPVGMLVLIMGLAQFGVELFINRNYFIAQIFVTPLALIGSSLSGAVTPSLLYDRLVETIIGVTVGMASLLALVAIRRYLAGRRPV